MIIREFQAEDMPVVMDVWLRSNMSAHSFIPEAYWRRNQKTVEEVYMPVAKTYVTEQDGRVMGFISIIEGNYIGALFVDPHEQGKGLGKALLQYCQERYARLELGVYADNERAVQFYKHCGFTIKSEQPNEDSGHMEYTMYWEA
ncbi:N-acetyltransferase [Paenibacillus sp. 1001270B_150601_E10]|uniref:N-acetyltransferase n=1 Tax=Paenibacillus sp. 1001270B_150601_E10 TaxID=2787079 RepID=UPI002B4BFAFC|nr:N-acetyltransferase [Paenibacillus sp. 1001270B_150601_E10]